MTDEWPEYDCEGCGAHVIVVGRETVPGSGLCSVCEWLCEFVPDPDEFWAAYRRLAHRLEPT